MMSLYASGQMRDEASLKATLTAIVLTKNEEVNLPACLESLKNVVDRIVVVDSYSSDNTCTVAREYGAQVYEHEFVNYGAQFQWAVDNCAIDSDWVLRIDADERLTKDSADELVKLCIKNIDTDVNGIVLRFKVRFMGKYLMHGGAYPMRKLCAFKLGKAYMEQRYMDEQIVLTEGKSVEMSHDLEHEDYKDLTFWIAKHNWYATRAAKDYLEHRNEHQETSSLDWHSSILRKLKYGIYYRLPSRLRTWLYFEYRYLLRGGFLDGRAGYWYAYFQAYWYRTLVDAKIYEAEKNGGIGETGSLNV